MASIDPVAEKIMWCRRCEKYVTQLFGEEGIDEEECPECERWGALDVYHYRNLKEDVWVSSFEPALGLDCYACSNYGYGEFFCNCERDNDSMLCDEKCVDRHLKFKHSGLSLGK